MNSLRCHTTSGALGQPRLLPAHSPLSRHWLAAWPRGCRFVGCGRLFPAECGRSPVQLGMRTLGIDLASQDERTAMAGIAWRQGVGIVEKPISPVSNEDALRAMKDAAWIGIDAPFGWPDSSSRYSLPTQRLASGPRISMTRRSVCGSPTSSSETTWEFGHSASHPIGSLCRRGAVLDSSPPTRLKALTALDVATSSRSIRALRLRSGTSRDAATSAAAMVSARLSNDRPARL